MEGKNCDVVMQKLYFKFCQKWGNFTCFLRLILQAIATFEIIFAKIVDKHGINCLKTQEPQEAREYILWSGLYILTLLV